MDFDRTMEIMASASANEKESREYFLTVMGDILYRNKSDHKELRACIIAYSPGFAVIPGTSNGRTLIGELLSGLWSTRAVAAGEDLVGKQARNALADAAIKFIWGDGKLGGEERCERACAYGMLLWDASIPSDYQGRLDRTMEIMRRRLRMRRRVVSTFSQ